MRIVLPFPPPELSPNSRKDRRAITGIRTSYKNDCYYAAKQQCLGKVLQVADGITYAVLLTFVPDDFRHRDADNLLGSIKYGLDSLALAMGVNDRQFKPITVDWSFREPGERGGYVVVELHEQIPLLPFDASSNEVMMKVRRVL